MCIRDRVSTQSTWGIQIYERKDPKMYKLALIVAFVGLAACGPWQGRYVVESGCDVRTCCCPTPGTQFDVLENQGIAFTTAVTGSCAGVNQITFTARFNPNDRTYRGAVFGYGGRSFNTNIVRTRTGMNFVNTDYSICSFSAWSVNAPTRVPKQLWIGKYVADQRCDANQCCCPNGGASLSVPWDRQLQIVSTSRGAFCSSGTYSILVSGPVEGSQNFEGEVQTISPAAKGRVRFWRTGYGVTVENITHPQCTYALLEPQKLSMMLLSRHSIKLRLQVIISFAIHQQTHPYITLCIPFGMKTPSPPHNEAQQQNHTRIFFLETDQMSIQAL
eukprot:TRINITY_DN181_c0_g1_i1.p1 TRINITY_DN181_c0_g1~~TRINITY_DN181_c0_g1_i1.p1  ORF type:complete len:362 (+),score=91.68 TRINITY_DN181_c0_g1_i1:94-1086(+)